MLTHGPTVKDHNPVQVKSKLELKTARVGDGVFASPGVRRLARELSIDLEVIKGTGAKGRTTKEDLHNHIRIKMNESSGVPRIPRKSIDFSKWTRLRSSDLPCLRRGWTVKQANSRIIILIMR